MVVDYSRWDNLEVSSDEELEQTRNAPVVHRLDPENAEEMQYGNITVRSKRTEEDASPPSTSKAKSKEGHIITETKKEGSEREDHLRLLCRNGARYEKYSWSQDRSASVLSVIVPEKSRAADVTVSLSGFDFKGGTKCAKSLLVEHKPSGTVVQGELEYYCRAEDDDLLSYWEIMDLKGSQKKNRVIRVELNKFQVANTVVMWWKKFFKGEREVDVSSIEDRKGKQTFAEVWKSAEDMFKQKIRHQK